MIRHGQFLQDIEVLDMMFQSLHDLGRRSAPTSRQWHAVFGGGPLGQIQDTRAEMHQYLRLPESLPEAAPSAGADPAPQIVSDDDFRLALKTFGRLYRGLGELRCAIGDYCPGLYAACAAQVAPQIKVYQDALERFVRWEEVEETLDEMERKFASEPVNGSPQDAALPTAPAEASP